jgi:two-component system NtrC family response regulator
VIERAMILDIDGEIVPENLSQEVLERSPLLDNSQTSMPVSLEGFVIPESGLSLEDVENALVRKALEMSGGNQTKAANLLKMPRDAFRRRMKRFGVM